jgi:hypothetical protein
MKRIVLIVMGLCAASWTTGCCHPCHSYSNCVDSCQPWYGSDDGGDCHKHRHRLSKKLKRSKDCDSCSDCCDDCSMQCCDNMQGVSPSAVAPAGQFMGADGGAMMGDGCQQCIGGNTTMMPGNGQAGCANCGTQTYGTQSFNGVPFDPMAGWTIQPSPGTSTSNEPTPAPPADGNGTMTPVPSRGQTAPINPGVAPPVPTPPASARR